MTTDHESAGPCTAPNRRSVVISTEMHASRRLGRLLELTGLAAHIERHSAASMVVTGGPTEMVVIDASPMADGVAQVEELRRGGVTTIIAILPVAYAAMVSDLFQAGADAVLDGSGSAEDLRAVIRAARAGHRVISTSFAQSHRPSHTESTAASPALAQLTPRQREVAQALATGAPAKVIAHRLGMAGGTVKIHATAIYQRLGVPNRTALASLLGAASPP